RIARALRPDAPRGKKVEDLIARDRKQPAAKSAVVAIVVQSPDGRRDRAQYILHQIGRIGVLQAPFAGKTIDHRPIQIDELLPRGVVRSVANLNQEAEAGERSLVARQ